jgi:hypothetical protein
MMADEPVTGAQGEPGLSGRERRAIAILSALSAAWPSTLKLVSLNGRLSVVRSHDPRYVLSPTERAKAVLASFDGIPSDGTPSGVQEPCGVCGGLIDGLPVSVHEDCLSGE